MVQNPKLVFINMAVSNELFYYLLSCHFYPPQSDSLAAVNSTVLVCEAPAVPAGTTTISYTLRLDSAPSPITYQVSINKLKSKTTLLNDKYMVKYNKFNILMFVFNNAIC